MAKIYGTMDDLRLENERVQDGRWVGLLDVLTWDVVKIPSAPVMPYEARWHPAPVLTHVPKNNLAKDIVEH